MDLDTIVFGEWTLKQVLMIGGGLVVLFILLGYIRKLFFSRPDDSEHVQAVRCRSCGWQGRVSRYAGRCPKCNEPLGDRKLKKDGA